MSAPLDLAAVRNARKGNPHRSARLRVVWGISAALLYLLCIIGANWLLATFGVVTVFGLAMPAGVFAAGVSFGARDWLQETAGRPAVILGIAVGAILSTVVSPLRYALASGLAFLCSETCDMLVYSPLRTNHRAWAVTASNTVGAVVDSAVFLLIAFGSLAFFWGQVIGKELMILPALVVLWLARRRRAVARTTKDEAMPTPAMNGPGACGKECPLAGGKVAGNTCPWIDHCAMWRDELAFERLEQREKAERLAKEHPEMFRGPR